MLIEFEVRKSEAINIKILEQTQKRKLESHNRTRGNPSLQRTGAADPFRSSGSGHTERSAERGGNLFLNPYNFVRNLPAQNAAFFAKQTPPKHAVYAGLTGYLECKVSVVTPLFISSSKPESSPEHSQHPEYAFFNINDQNTRRKVIPGSSLRGMVRSIYETITCSCYSVFEDVTLSRRMDAYEGKDLTPARVIKGKDEEWQLELLAGRKSDRGYPMKAAWISLYDPINGSPQQRRKKISLKDFHHGDQAWAVLEIFQRKENTYNIYIWNVLELFDNKEDAEQFKAEYGRDVIVESGWICITRQNTERKHDERFFFGESEIVDLPERVRKNYAEIVKDYRDRHQEEVQAEIRANTIDEYNATHGTPKLSRFMVAPDDGRNDGLKNGDLVYVKVERGKALYIIPVQISRQMYEHSVGELLPVHLRPCTNYQELCPACRLFGWVKGRDKGEKAEKNLTVNVAYAGRVFFEQAELVNEALGIGNRTLADLASPKPTTTFFYLSDNHDARKFIPKRDGFNPLKQHLRGRKFYRHHHSFHWQPAEKTKRNRTLVDPVHPGSDFKFRIRFENLQPEELGALIWSIELDEGMHHRLGYGKPLGLGSVKLSIAEGYAYDLQERYSSLKIDGRKPINFLDYVEVFKKSFASAFDLKFEDSDTFKDLLAILKGQPNLQIHYPRKRVSHNPKGDENFKWFARPSAEKTLGLASKDEGLQYNSDF